MGLDEHAFAHERDPFSETMLQIFFLSRSENVYWRNKALEKETAHYTYYTH